MAYESDRTGAEVDATLDDADAHHVDTGNPHSVTFDQVKGAGELEATNWRTTPANLVADSDGVTFDIDMSSNGVRIIGIDESSVVFNLSNIAPGRKVICIIYASVSGFDPVFTFPGWIFVGAAAPSSIAAGKYAKLELTAFGTTDEEVIAEYAEEP